MGCFNQAKKGIRRFRQEIRGATSGPVLSSLAALIGAAQHEEFWTSAERREWVVGQMKSQFKTELTEGAIRASLEVVLSQMKRYGVTDNAVKAAEMFGATAEDTAAADAAVDEGEGEGS